ncbi:MAG TPA: hypothetical protein VFO79_05515, partial [Xanthomonadales bacterium]|nr:hypothetical protein [Xanthomonadales bacterium]
MSGFAATVAALGAHGDVHEIAGWSALPDDARAALSQRLVDAGLAAGLAVAGDLASGSMDFIGDRGSGWPDVRLQRSDDDRLALG